MERLNPVIALSAILLVAFSALTLMQSDSEVVKIVEKDRSTNLMKGSVFEIQFESGGTDRYNYITHRENYCSSHPNASECPPEDLPEKPPVMQEFSFEQTSENPDTYKPEKSICLEEDVYVNCSGFSKFDEIFS